MMKALKISSKDSAIKDARKKQTCGTKTLVQVDNQNC